MRVRAWVRESADYVIALGLAVLLIASIVTEPKLSPMPALVLLALAETVPLAWRRRSPAIVATVCVVAYAGLNAVATGPYPPDVAVIPAVWAVFTAAAYTNGRTVIIVGVATFVAVEVAWVVTPEGHPDDFLPWLLWGGPFGVGRLTRRRDVTVSALTAQTHQLEERRAAAELDAARRERDRIARELHDVVAHAVSVMVVQAGAERLALAAEGPDIDRSSSALGRIEQIGRDALTELRTMLGVLRDPHQTAQPGPADPQPRLDTIGVLIDRIRRDGLPVTLHVVGEPQPVNAGVSLSAYRIVQEGVTNAVKHGASGPVEVRLEYAAGRLNIDVDNPCPPMPTTNASGYGLIGARERASSVAGDFSAGPHKGGWRLHASLPYEPAGAVAAART